MTSDLTNILQNSIDNLLLAEEQVQKKDGQKESEEFTLAKFWADLISVAQRLSFECTKVCISFSKPPTPSTSETSSMLGSVERVVLAMVSVVYRLPLDCGATLHTEVQYAVVRAIQAARLLLKIIKDEGGQAVDARYRQSTGVAWQGCNMLEKCPQDNKAAVLKGLREQNSLVCDAFSEISEALEGDGSGWSGLGLEGDQDHEEEEEEERWSNEDKDLLGPSINLIKGAKILYKRLLAAVEKNGSCDSPANIRDLDQLHQDCCHVSRIVDTLILDLYPPLSVTNMEEQSHNLANQLLSALKTCAQTHVAGEAEQPHLEFIQKAVDHNLHQMKEKLSHR